MWKVFLLEETQILLLFFLVFAQSTMFARSMVMVASCSRDEFHQQGLENP